jgi:aerobic carbon-monoxide dehydrogenase medium subunit
MHAFTYHRPHDIASAVSLLETASEPKLLAGGMTLLPTLKQRLAAPSDPIDLAGIDGLVGIRQEGQELVIGAMTCHADVAASTAVGLAIPALSVLAGGIGDPAVRHRGTIGGSSANADPAADYPAGLVALNATVETNERRIAADDFFVGLFETALRPSEIVVAVRFPIPDAARYRKFRHPASGYAVVGVMVARFGSAVRVAVTGAGPKVFRVREMEEVLAHRFEANAIRAIRVAPEELMGDLHCSAEYRSHLISVLARRAVEDHQSA